MPLVSYSQLGMIMWQVFSSSYIFLIFFVSKGSRDNYDNKYNQLKDEIDPHSVVEASYTYKMLVDGLQSYEKYIKNMMKYKYLPA